MIKITDQLKSMPILISDGAWGTFLQNEGLEAGDCPELWNIDHPDVVLKIAQSYIDAGADMIETNSFGGSRIKLDNYGLGNRTFEINRKAAEISREAAGSDKHVLGSIGPTGKFLITGEVSAEQLYDVFAEQAKALQSGGADAIIIETMTDLEEAQIAVQAAKENTSCEIICTMTFEKTVDNEYRTMMGVSPEQMVNEIISSGADIIGANCGNGISGMVQIVEEIRAINKEIPVLIHANAGMPQLRDGKTFFPESPEEMAAFIPDIRKAGANIIGGCCGTTPEHILKLAGGYKINSVHKE